MGSYNIVVSPRVDKDLRKLPKNIIKTISLVIDGLAKNPRPDGCKKLRGAHVEEYRVKAKRDYRVLYQVYDKEKIIHVLRVLDRKEAYR
ncbi:type II toxin-antitoxin system RelE/ParE family toxin [bacterium]|nr:type II toxin-antitoxin system RelE/ParE family toxin [bacterium]MBU1918668.1 type II toxin-antitoxin system RelE/ParE family toxin [bacterium]